MSGQTTSLFASHAADVTDEIGVISSSMMSYPGFEPIIAAYVAGLPELVISLKKFLAANDLKSLHRLAHQQRGAGGSYGFESVSNIAGHLEDGLRAGQPFEITRRQVDKFIQLLRRIEGYVDPI